jgi:hypothetical protein
MSKKARGEGCTPEVHLWERNVRHGDREECHKLGPVGSENIFGKQRLVHAGVLVLAQVRTILGWDVPVSIHDDGRLTCGEDGGGSEGEGSKRVEATKLEQKNPSPNVANMYVTYVPEKVWEQGSPMTMLHVCATHCHFAEGRSLS